MAKFLVAEDEPLRKHSGLSACFTAATNSRDHPTSSTGAASKNEFLEGEDSERQSSEDTQQQQTGSEKQLADSARADVIASESDGETSGPVFFTLSDPDVLNCPICLEPLCSTVYQCENGHIACSSCCTTMKNKCSNCSFPIGYIRCRAIERVLESVKVRCRNMPRGCKETLSYSKILAHEKACTYTPCSCPHLGCHYVGISKRVYKHFAREHSQSSIQFNFNNDISVSLGRNQKAVFLQERVLKTLFILNQSVESVGRFVNIVCVAPTSEKGAFMYDLTASYGNSSVKLESTVDVMPKWEVKPPSKIYLMVPGHIIRSCGHLILELTIWRNPLHSSEGDHTHL